LARKVGIESNWRTEEETILNLKIFGEKSKERSSIKIISLLSFTIDFAFEDNHSIHS